MPAFELPDANGETIRSADLQGKVVVVRFWATWWTICQSEMPSVQRVHEAFRDKDVVVLAISVDGGGEKAVKSFMAKRGYTFTTPVDVRMDIARKFGVRGVPTTYVINRQGAIVAHGFGPVDFDSPAFVQYIQTLAAEPRG
jgi:peroxiredoxin